MNVHSKKRQRKEQRLLPHGLSAHDLGDKREQILAAALALFSTKGYHGTAVPEIADLARVGAGTVYRYFENKEALVNELFRHWKGLLFSHLMAGFPVGGKPREQFHALFSRLTDFAQTHARALDFLELHHHGEYLDAQSIAVEQNLLGAIRAIVIHAQNERVLKPLPPEILGGIVYGAFMGLVTMNRKGILEMTPKVVETAEELLWEAIRR